MLRKLLYQSLFQVPRRILPPPDGIQEIDLRTRSMATSVFAIVAALAQFTSFEPRGAITSTVPQGRFSQSPEIFYPTNKPQPLLPSSQHQFTSFAPRGTIVSTTPQGWMSQQPEVFYKPLPASNYLVAAQHQFTSFAPRGTITTTVQPSDGIQDLDQNPAQRPFPEAQQQFIAAALTPAPAFVDGTQDLDQPTPRKPVGTTFDEATASPAGTIVSITPGGGDESSSAEVVNISLPQAPTHSASQQQFTSFTSFAATGTFVGLDGEQDFDELPQRKPFKVAWFDDATGAPFTPVVATATVPPFSGSWPERIAVPRPIEMLLDVGTLGPLTVPAVIGPFASNWPQASVLRSMEALLDDGTGSQFPAVINFPQGFMLQSPERFGKKVPAAQQQFGSLTTTGSITITTPQGWMFTQPERIKKPLPPAQQQFASYSAITGQIAIGVIPTQIATIHTTVVYKRRVIHQGLVRTPRPIPQPSVEGWTGIFPASVDSSRLVDAYIGQAQGPQFLYPYVGPPLSDAFIKPLAAAQQQFTLTPSGVVVAATPQGWTFQQPPAFFKPQFGAVALDGIHQLAQVTQFTQQGWMLESPRVFIKALAAASQQFTGFVPLGFLNPPQPLFSFGVEPNRLKPFINVDFSYEKPQGPAAPQFQGWRTTVSPDLFRKPFGASQQAFVSSNFTAPFLITPQGWAGVFPAQVDSWRIVEAAGGHAQGAPFLQPWGYVSPFEPFAIRKPFGSGQQQFGSKSFEPQATIISITPQGWQGIFPAVLDSWRNVEAAVGHSQGPPFTRPWGWNEPWPYQAIKASLKPTQQQFTSSHLRAPPIVFSVTPQGWMGQHPDRFIKPAWRATQPQWVAPFLRHLLPSATTPQGWAGDYPDDLPQYRYIQPDLGTASGQPFQPFWGWASQQPDSFLRPIPPAQQLFSALGMPRLSTFAPDGFRFQSPETFIKQLAASQQLFAGLAPFAAPSTTPLGWMYAQPETRIKPVPAGEQQWEADQLFGLVPTRLPTGGKVPFQERFIKQLAASLQPFGTLGPFAAPSAILRGWMGQHPDVFLKGLNAAHQLWETHQLYGVIPFSQGPSGCYHPQSPDLFIKALAASQQQFVSLTPNNITTTTPQGWTLQSTPEWFVRPLAPSQQQFVSLTPRNITSTTSQGFMMLDPEVRIKPLAASLQQWEADQLFGAVPFFQGPSGAYFTQSPERFIQALASAQQPFTALGPFNARSTTPQGWMLQTTPEQFVRPLASSQQLFTTIGDMFVPPTPSGSFQQSPDWFIKALASSQQQFELSQKYGIVPFPPVFGGNSPQSPDLFIKALAPTQQQFSTLQLTGTITIVYPQGWISQHPDLFFKPFYVPQVQYSTYPPQGSVPTRFIPFGWASQQPDLFIKGINATLQMNWQDYPTQGNVPTAATPQGWYNNAASYVELNLVPPLLQGWYVNPIIQQFEAYGPQIVPPSPPEDVGFSQDGVWDPDLHRRALIQQGKWDELADFDRRQAQIHWDPKQQKQALAEQRKLRKLQEQFARHERERSDKLRRTLMAVSDRLEHPLDEPAAAQPELPGIVAPKPSRAEPLRRMVAAGVEHFKLDDLLRTREAYQRDLKAAERKILDAVIERLEAEEERDLELILLNL